MLGKKRESGESRSCRQETSQRCSDELPLGMICSSSTPKTGNNQPPESQAITIPRRDAGARTKSPSSSFKCIALLVLMGNSQIRTCLNKEHNGSCRPEMRSLELSLKAGGGSPTWGEPLQARTLQRAVPHEMRPGGRGR